MVWLYDKRGNKPPVCVPIEEVAQAAGYYTPDDETLLDRGVEAPTNPVFEKLLNGQPISPQERAQLALYIAVMLRRVPYRRRKTFEEIVPKALEETFAETRGITQSCV